jgi:hypothetical protein
MITSWSWQWLWPSLYKSNINDICFRKFRGWFCSFSSHSPIPLTEWTDHVNIYLMTKPHWLTGHGNQRLMKQSGREFSSINMRNQCIAGIEHKCGDSQFWYGLMNIKQLFTIIVKKCGEWTKTRFWEDWWTGDRPLNQSYPRLYSIGFGKGISVADSFDRGWGGFQFRRMLCGDTLNLWYTGTV